MTSPYPGIVHHLSGRCVRAPTRIFLRGSRSVDGALAQNEKGPTAFSFLAPSGLTPKDSRVRSTPWSVFQDGVIGGISLGRGRPNGCVPPFTSPGETHKANVAQRAPACKLVAPPEPPPTGLGLVHPLPLEKETNKTHHTAGNEFPPNSFRLF